MARLLVAFATAALAAAAVGLPRSSNTRCKRFILISQTRSGTGYVVRKLKGHPSLQCANEILGEADVQRGRDVKFSALMRKMNSVMHDLCARTKGDRGALVGFKWMTTQGHAEHHGKILEYLQRHSKTKILYMWRRNVVRQIISRVGIRSKDPGNTPHPKVGEFVNASSKVSLAEGGLLLQRVNKTLADRATTRSYYSGVDALTVYYEDLIESSPAYNESWDRVFDYLGVPRVELPRAELVMIHQDKPILAPVANAPGVHATLVEECATMRWGLDLGGACEELVGDCPCDPCDACRPDPDVLATPKHTHATRAQSLLVQAAQRNYTGATNAKRFASIQRQMRDLQLEKDLELVRLRARVAELEARR